MTKLNAPKYQQIINDFKNYLETTNRAQGTIESYLSHLNKLKIFMKSKNVLTTTQSDIHKFHLCLKSKYKVTTIDNIFAALNVFFSFVKRKYRLNCNIEMPNIRTPLKNGKDIDDLTPDEFRLIVCQANESDDKRFVALITTLLYSGMRISEVLQLQIADVSSDYTTVIGKGGVIRTVYIGHPQIKKTLNEYLKVRRQPFSSTTRSLFVGERGPLTRQTAHRLMKKYATLAEIDHRKAHCHITRHTFVKMCLSNGLSLDDTADLVGHRDVNSTKYYLEKSKDQYSELAKNLEF